MPEHRQLSSDRQRVLTGTLLAFPLLILLAAGPLWAWLLVVLLAVALGLWEFRQLVIPDGIPLQLRIIYILAGLCLPTAAAFGGPLGLHGALVASLFAGFLCLLLFSPTDPTSSQVFSKLSLGWLYIPYLLSYVLLFGVNGRGRGWILFTIAVIVACDAGAYYIGKRFGRHKLYPQVSPKKTIEGSVGGFIAAIVTGLVFGYFCLNGLPAGRLLWISCCLAAVGQLGDLFESMLKRMAGKKDSSGLLPGHGGVLDRLDSLFFAFPASWFFSIWTS